ncbi:MAG: aminomethyl-transferring glycine dehydrogenase [Proteobacteria bacterium]|nr:aminomethyl-transferring glycine dehydrogenase [Cystobacterineae bacterium]MCL2258538.1 aminomethyl-transferring glycine dehydrogenase [Cystobacterineae bacterium]MCL2315125.1 aminomethyl-transferring glycine dehydrogenase [Pseudomonadota bacterium]
MQGFFQERHIGPSPQQLQEMLEVLGVNSLEQLMEEVVPLGLRLQSPWLGGAPKTEVELLQELSQMAAQNQVCRSLIGMGYYGTYCPRIIARNIFENPCWYTHYTPYQAELAQGRLEALMNFQTMVVDLTGMEVANASLLDEGTAAAEAMAMLKAVSKSEARRFFASEKCHPQTLAVLQTRAKPLGIEVVIGDEFSAPLGEGFFGLLTQYPATDGAVIDMRAFSAALREQGIKLAIASDLLALCLLTPPGEWGADVVIGSSQRLGIPMGLGGPHAAFFATRQSHVRHMPGRLIGHSIDAHGKPALRMALQTREQHIRREKATSNICTSQVLLAVMASMYAVYHGPEGLKAIAKRIHTLASALADGLVRLGFGLKHAFFFDTLHVCCDSDEQAKAIVQRAQAQQICFRRIGPRGIGISLDELTTRAEVLQVLGIFAAGAGGVGGGDTLFQSPSTYLPEALRRQTPFLTHPVFNCCRSETQMLRYIHSLETRDLSLADAMIPLGSCTMKLTATSQMEPLSWAAFANIHPFAPREQWQGYARLLEALSEALKDITGFAGISFMPNSGAQGEFAGLMVIRQYLEENHQQQRDICLIPESAHGTNPASATMAGFQTSVVRCDEKGNIDVEDLQQKLNMHAGRIAALMLTYPSTYGVFDDHIVEICERVHAAGAQVYMDGANMNALVGICRPAELGADVCHLNLHKTFAIPHGGGGPGAGPICVAPHLTPFLPKHPLLEGAGEGGDSRVEGSGAKGSLGPIASAPFGSASILLIPWSYIKLMGVEGLTQATKVAIVNANYIAKRLCEHFPVVFVGARGWVAHECILDLRGFKSIGIEVEDVAKRLMDYGFHAPTVSFPVAGTLMVEPTESESKEELDRFCEALIEIRREIREIEEGKQPRDDNLLKGAPHTALALTEEPWTHPYSRQRAVFPMAFVAGKKFWPSVSRINSSYGDRNLCCVWPSVH